MTRVLEIGGYAAAYAGRLFVHAGCDVVRAEAGQRDPAWASEQAMSAFLHAGKRHASVEESTLEELANRADVVIAHLPNADAVDESGIDTWDAPVKVAVTPFGRTGPRRNWRATPNVLLAMGGYTALMGDADREPLSLPGHYLEFQAGTLAYSAASSLLRSGEQNVVDIGMLETVMTLSQFTTVRWHCTGEHRTRHGSDFWFVAPSDLFRCADGWAYVSIVPAFWDAFTVFLDHPQLLVDPRFETNDLRMANRDALHEAVAAAFLGMTVAEVNERTETCRVPVGVVTTLKDVLEDEHLAFRNFWQEVDTDEGAVRVPKPPYRIEALKHA